MTLRERMEARRAALLSERAIAEAATPGPWEVDLLSPILCSGEMVVCDGALADLHHIAAQDPAATIARVDRELVGIDADLALLDSGYVDFRGHPTVESLTFEGFQRFVLANLAARYPEDDR